MTSWLLNHGSQSLWDPLQKHQKVKTYDYSWWFMKNNFFFLFSQPSGRMTTPAKASYLTKAFKCVLSLPYQWEEFIVWRMPLHGACMFEIGNLLNLNLTPIVTNKHPQKTLSKLYEWLSCRVIFIRFIISFLKGTVTICLSTIRKPWNLFLNIISAWS